MDYEKMYKEALERAREYWETDNDNTLDIKAKGTMEHLFPELKESENEKIRKEIMSYIKSSGAITNKQWIAWLEKQEGCEYIKKDWLEHIKQSWYKEGFIDGKYNGGTSKEWTINDAATLKELIDFLENGTAKLQHDLTRYANWLKIQFTPIEKQGEQNIEKKELKKVENTRPLLSDFFNAEYERGKADTLQSIKWNEEDESMYTRTLGILGKCYMGQLPTKVEEELNWFKSIKNRIGG